MRRFALLLPILLATPALACPPAPGQFAPNCVNNGDSVDGFSQFFLVDLSRLVPQGEIGPATPDIVLSLLPLVPPDSGVALGNFSNLWLPPTNSTAGPPAYQIAPGVPGRAPGEVQVGDPVRDNRTGQIIGTVVNTSMNVGRPPLAPGTVLPTAGFGAGAGFVVRTPDGRDIVVFHFAVGTETGPSAPTAPAPPPAATVAAPAAPVSIVRASGQPVLLTPAPPPRSLPGTPVGEGTLLVTAGASNTQVPVTIVRHPDGSLVAVDAQGVVRGTAEERKAGPFGLTYKVTPLPSQPPVAVSAPALSPAPPPSPFPATATEVRRDVFGPGRSRTSHPNTHANAKAAGQPIVVSGSPVALYNDRAVSDPSGGLLQALDGANAILQGAKAQLVAAVRDGRVAGQVSADGRSATVAVAGLDSAKPYLDLIDAAAIEIGDLQAATAAVSAGRDFRTTQSPEPPVQQQEREALDHNYLFLQEGESIL